MIFLYFYKFSLSLDAIKVSLENITVTKTQLVYECEEFNMQINWIEEIRIRDLLSKFM